MELEETNELDSEQQSTTFDVETDMEIEEDENDFT